MTSLAYPSYSFHVFLWAVRCNYITHIALGYEWMRECKSVDAQYMREFSVNS